MHICNASLWTKGPCIVELLVGNRADIKVSVTIDPPNLQRYYFVYGQTSMKLKEIIRCQVKGWKPFSIIVILIFDLSAK